MNATILAVNAPAPANVGPATSDPELARVVEPVLSAEPLADVEPSERGLYRRSVAYFLFGFGPNRNTIITDEP